MLKTYRKNKTDDTQTEKTSAHLSDGAVVDLLSVAQTTEEEAHSENQQKVGQNGAQEGSLNNADLALGQGDAKFGQYTSVMNSIR